MTLADHPGPCTSCGEPLGATTCCDSSGGHYHPWCYDEEMRRKNSAVSQRVQRRKTTTRGKSTTLWRCQQCLVWCSGSGRWVWTTPPKYMCLECARKEERAAE